MVSFIPGWNFSPANGLKKEREHAYLLCFRTSVNFLTEIGVLGPGWNWPCNRNNISARWAERNFSPGWNSPCNQALRHDSYLQAHCRIKLKEGRKVLFRKQPAASPSPSSLTTRQRKEEALATVPTWLSNCEKYIHACWPSWQVT